MLLLLFHKSNNFSEEWVFQPEGRVMDPATQSPLLPGCCAATAPELCVFTTGVQSARER